MTSVPLVRRPPDIEALIEALVQARVDFVITGSVAAQLHGARLDPGDLDITPSLERENLQRLVKVLLAIDAVPQLFGYWTTDADGEQKWIEIEATPELRANWVPDVDDLTTLDNLYFSRLGDLDVVPRLTGTFEVLMKRAARKNWGDHEVFIADIETLIKGMTKGGQPRRKKDRLRVEQLRAVAKTQ